MSKKTKDALITNEEAQTNSGSSKPPTELLHLIEIVNEIGVMYRVNFPDLPSSQTIAEKLYSELSPYSEADVERYSKHKFWIENDPLSAKPAKKRKANYTPGNPPSPPPFIPSIKRVTNEQILDEIKRLTRDLPKLYGFLFGDAQDLYPDTNKRYVKNTNAKWNERIEGVIDKYDDILLFAVNLAPIAVISTIHIGKFGLEKLRQLKLRQNYYLDMPSSRYYVVKGKFEFELDLLAQHLQGMEAARLRYCLVCQSVFWAYDLRKIYCSRKCSNRFNQKKWYAKPDKKEQFLRNKKAEYHINKGSNRFPSRVKKDIKE